MIVPRPYQEETIDILWSELHKENDLLAVLPTASGKTIIFTLLLRRALKRMSDVGREFHSMILVNQIKLVTQTKEKLLSSIQEDDISIHCGSLGQYGENSITVASIDTIWRKPVFLNLIIIDEAHNADNSRIYQEFIEGCLELNPKLKIIRLTATPFTAAGGYIFGKGKPNSRITYRKTLQDMISMNYIVEPIFSSTKESFDTTKMRKRKGDFIQKDLDKLSQDRDKIRKQVADALSRLSDRKKIVWSCVSIDHAEIVQEEISKYEAATIIHSKLKRSEQRLNLQEFENGDVRHISSVTMVSEGYDFPGIDAIVCMRPTRSPVLYVQLIGRGLRLFPGKKNCLFLDYGNVVENLGHPNNPFVKDPNKSKKEQNQEEKRLIETVTICPACSHYIFLPARACRQCGYELVKPQEQEKAKNLTVRAKSYRFNQELKRIDTVDLMSWEIDWKYKSKAGNECLKIQYRTLLNTFTEWIKIGTYFHKVFMNEYESHGRKCPKKIKIERDGKWTNVKARYY